MKCNFDVRVRSTISGSEFVLKACRTPPGRSYKEWELVTDDGYVYGWVSERALSAGNWEEVGAPAPAPSDPWSDPWGDWTGWAASKPAPAKPKCDCGGAKANTSHSAWCTTSTK